MKRFILVLAILMVAATGYNQTSRRSANSNDSAVRTSRKSNTNEKSSSSKSTTRTRQNSSRNTNNNVSNNDRTSRSSSTTEQKRSSDTRSANRNVNSNSERAPQRSTSTVQRRSTETKSANRNVNSSSERAPQRSTSTVQRRSTDTKSANQTVRSRRVGTTPSRSVNKTSSRNVHVNYPSSRSYRERHTVTHVYHKAPKSRSYRAKRYVYRTPVHVNIIWTDELHRRYIRMYPQVRYYNYHIGYRINTISSYYADRYIGDVMNVYGKITEVFYAYDADEYYLYMGPHYPYQDFTVVIPGHIGRRFSDRPERFFTGAYLNVTGLITSYDRKPEIVVKERFQLDIY